MHGLRVSEAQAAAGFELAGVYRLDGAADDFGDVGAGVEAERQHARHPDVDGLAGQLGNAEIEEEGPDQQRGSPEDADEGGGDPAQHHAGGDLQEPHEEADQHGQGEGNRGDQDSVAKALHQCREAVGQEVPEAGLGGLRGVLEVLVQDFLVLAAGLQLRQAGVERLEQFRVLALVDGEAVGAAFFLLGHGLESVVLADAVGQDRIVIENGDGVP
ncbi:hypothetical protein D9M72_511950 [compost metagenome]